ncbi:MAG TPA: amino acid adenylation domain-containing protein [Thermoanaerobaculia bacterium]|nr:amino acid adenylation domain-containing protein [Thermoanaerobaculia bacterium]
MSEAIIGGFQLSPLQRRVWSLQERDSGQPYRALCLLRIDGDLSRERVKAAVRTVVARHEILRTGFERLPGMQLPLQVIRDGAPLELEPPDLRGLSAEERQAGLAGLWEAAQRMPLDTDGGSPLVWSLVPLGSREHALLLAAPALCLDTAGLRALAAEVVGACGDGSPLDDDEVQEPVQYADYAEVLDNLLASEEAREGLEYWRRLDLSSLNDASLPFLRRPAGAERIEPASMRVRLPRGVAEGADALARRLGVEPRVVYMAAWSLVLGRLTGRLAITLGVAYDGRRYQELAGAPGLFARHLPVQCGLEPSRTVSAELERIAEATAEHRDWQDCFDWTALGLAGDGTAPPFFPFCFELEERAPLAEAGGLRVERLRQSVWADRFQLKLTCVREGAGMTAELQFDAAVLSAAAVGRLAAQLARLLESAIENPGQPIGALDLLASWTAHELLVEDNDTALELGADRCLHELVEEQVAKTPSHTAVIFEGQDLTYEELNVRANRLAHALQRIGVGPDVRVAVCMERAPEMVVSLLGILKAGGAYVPLDPGYPADRLELMLGDSGAALLLTQERLLPVLPESGLPRICVDGEAELHWEEGAENPRVPVEPRNLAYVIYTSGSTGRPKGVMIPHAAINNRLLWMGRRFGLGEGERVLQKTSFSFDASVWELFLPLLTGGIVVLARPGGQQDNAYMARTIAREGVSVLQLVPSMLRLFLEEPEVNACGSLRHLFCGGEALSRDLQERCFERLDAELVNLYGPTEVSIDATYWVCGRGSDLPLVPIGSPLSNIRVLLLDAEMRPVPFGATGEVCVGGAGLARGYWGLPGTTAEKFVPDPFAPEPGGRLYRTGDLSRFVAPGVVAFAGRVDHQVKVRGFRIEPGEIEAVLRSHEAVRDAVVVARKDAAGDHLVAYVVPRETDSLSDLRRWLGERLPEHMVPAFVVELASFPLLPNGKVDRAALPAPEPERRSVEAYLAPRTSTEEVLATLWEDLLGCKRVGVHDDFFDLGGHSLLATQLVSRLRQGMGIELSLRAIFETPTLAGLATEVDHVRRGGETSEAPPIRPVPRDRSLPLSFAQQRLWLLDRLAPGSAAYNLPMGLRLEGPLQASALTRALSEIVRRHEALRTTFAELDGEPVQLIAAPAPWHLPVIDLDALPVERREGVSQELTRAQARRGFDLVRGPLLRVLLLRLGPGEHVLLATLHHIVSDGWSTGILVRELAHLYERAVERQPTRLMELPVQYADFAVWQRGWLQGEVLEAHLDYWRHQLGAEIPVLQLPTDRSRPAVQTTRGAVEAEWLSPRLTNELERLSRGEGVTLFMTLLAAFQALLARYSGQSDIVVGSPVANRHRLEIESVIGCFINTLVLRTDLSALGSFRELLGQVREVALGASAFQGLPFEKLVEELQPRRDLSRSPLFDVLFMLQNVPFEQLQLPGLTLSPMRVDAGRAPFDWTLSLAPTERGLLASLEYNRDLFDAATAARALRHYERLLTTWTQTPGADVWETPLLSPAEEHQVRTEWNRWGDGFPTGVGVHQLIADQARRTPEGVAVVFEGEVWTYRDLADRSAAVARRLRALGAGPGALVGLFVDRSAGMVAALLGTLEAGAAYVPLDPAQPRERLALMLEEATPAVIVSQDHLRGDLPPVGAPVLFLEEIGEGEDSGGVPVPAFQPTGDEPAYVLFTSGSTGRPKGVQVPHRALVNFLCSMRECPGIHSGDVWLAVTPISFDIAGLELYLPLLAGARVVLASRETVVDGARLLSLLRESGATVMQATPAGWRLLLEAGWGSPDLTVLCGGEALPRQLAEDLHARAREVWNLYGPTETTIWSTVERVKPGAGTAAVAIGLPIANTQVHVLDRALRPVPAGLAGELCIGGVGLATGYLRRPDLTAERFIPDPCGSDAGARLYRTGDLARRLADGRLEYLGRLDHQIKVRGFRIELEEIEAVLARHPEIRQTVVLARQDTPGEPRIVAYLVGDGVVNDAGLRTFLKDRLPDYMVPSAFVRLAALPLTPNGKIDRRALPPPPAERGGDSALPATPVAEVLAGLWTELLAVDPIGLHDDFFALGGHSLMAARLIARVRETFGVELSLRRVFEAPTLAALAAAVDAALQEGRGAVAPPLRRMPSLAREGGAPLSFAQQRLWFIDQLQPGSPAYNLPVVLRLSGDLDVEALRETLAEILRRHEILRTVYPMAEDGGPRVTVSSEVGPALSVLDLRPVPAGEREGEALRLARAEVRRPFDLAAGPLMRTLLLRLGEADHVAVFTIHHIVSDGWSMGVLVREVGQIYPALLAGLPSPLPDLPLQYADFAVWQREWLQGEVLAERTAWWREQLAGIPAVLELPADRPRPAVQSHRGSTLPFALSAGATRDLRSLGRSRRATLFMTLLGGFQTLLYRYTGQSDVVVGTPVANRDRSELEGLIGFLVNTLVLRARFEGVPTFGDLLGRLRETALEAHARQELPFEKLVEELQPQRDLSYSPIFQAMLALQNAPAEALSLPGLEAEPLDARGNSAKFDLLLTLTESEAGLSGSMEYATDLFEAATIERLLGHLRVLLEGAAADPGLHVSDLPLLTGAEERQVVREWNDTAFAIPDEFCLHQRIEAQAGLTPDATAVVWRDLSLTYRELNARANRLACHLRAAGAGPDGRVGVCLERSEALVIALLAVLKSGAAYVPLDPGYPDERLTFMLQDARPSVCITDEAIRPRLTGAVPLLCLDTQREEVARWSGKDLAASATLDNLAYVIYTSGSTGRPKGAMIPHRGICNRLVWMQAQYGLTGGDRVLQKTPFSFDVSVWEFFWPLLAGACIVVAEPGGHRDSAYLVRTIGEQEVTILHFVPSMLQAFLEEEHLEACDGVRLVVCSGEALPLDLQKRFFEVMGAELHNLYGPTEASVDVTYHACRRGTPLRSVPIGRPIFNTQIYIVDPGLRPLPVGVAGELLIGGDGVGRGYLDRAALTAETFIADPFSAAPGARLYRTHDLARLLPDGAIEFLGRIDNQVKVRGFRIELGEIEAVLAEHPAVREAAVMAQQGRSGAPSLVAWFVVQDEPLSVDGLRAFLRQRLPEYMVPTTFVRLPALPLNANGKLDRKVLPSLAGERVEPGRTYAAPSTYLEKTLAEIWVQVLKVEEMGVHDNFFSLGGDSILSLQVTAQARRRGLRLALQQIFMHQTIAELARALEETPAETGAVTVTDSGDEPFGLLSPEDRRKLPDFVEDAYPLTMLQAGMLYHMGLNPDAPAYHNVNSVHLRGRFEAATFQEAVLQVVARHAALRTSFDLAGYSQGLQLVHRAAFLPVAVEDLRYLTATEQERAIEELMERETRRPFDLAQPPLLRLHVFLRSDDTFQLTLTEHHAIFDGWSLHSTLNEIFDRYFTLLNGESVPEAAAPAPGAAFRDYLRLESDAAASASSRRFWDEKLSDCTVMELPSWHATARGSRPARVEMLPVPVPREISDALQQLSRSTGVPLKSVLLAVHLKVMSVLWGQEDVLTGMGTHGRPEEAGGEDVRGLFLNMVPCRLRVRSGQTWRELARNAFELERELIPHQRYPLAALQKSRGGQRLFDTLFNFVHFHVVSDMLQSGRLEVLGFRKYEATSFRLLTLFAISLVKSQVTLELDFDGAELTREQVSTIGDLYARAMAAMAEAPDQSHDVLLPLSEAARHQALVEWPDTATAYPREAAVPELFELQAAQTPGAIAVEFGADRLTYDELDHQANQLACSLRRLEVGPEVPVAVFMERSHRMVVTFLGILKAGGYYVPLDPSYPRERLEVMLDDSGARVLLTEERLASLLPAPGLTVLRLDSQWEEVARESGAPLDRRSSADNLAYVIYTSGSTGRPKGVSIPHRGIVRLVKGTNYVQVGADDHVAQASNTSFDAATFEIWGALLNGARVVGIPREVALSPQDLAATIRDRRITVLFQTTALFNQTVRLVPDAYAGIRRHLVGGEAFDPRAFEALQLGGRPPERFANIYGPTESTTYATWYPMDRLPDGTSVPIGRPIANTTTYVLSEAGQPVPMATPGELHIGGDGLARGYLGRPELTAEKFVPHPFAATPGERLYRTGDLVRPLSGGDIEFLGRRDLQVKIRGFRIELDEIRIVLEQHPAVVESFVMVREDQPGERRLVAYFVPVSGGASEIQALREHLREKLPDYMVPSAFVPLDALPMSVNGKVDRRLLPTPDWSQPEKQESYAGPRDAVEEALVEIWQQVLGVARIGIHDNFFELGGDSILSIQIVARAGEKGLRLTPGNIFQHPTVAELAMIAEAAETATRASASASGTGEVPLTPIQTWFFEQDLPRPHHFNQSMLLEVLAPVPPAALATVVEHLVEQHDALRLRFERTASGWRQVQAPSGGCTSLSRVDLAALPAELWKAEVEAVCAQVQQSLDLTRGPLLRAVLIDRGAAGSARLMMAVHHLVVDAVSWRVLLQDLQVAYRQVAAGGVALVPARTTSFQHWAERLREYAATAAIRQELSYWTDPARAEAAFVPRDFLEGDNVKESIRAVAVWLEPDETQQLVQEVPRVYQTQINDALLTGLALAFARWTGERSLLVDLESHGREEIFPDVDLSRTVGWFTNLAPVLLRVEEGLEPEGSLKAVKEQLRAVPRRGIGYGLLRYMAPEPGVAGELRRLPRAQVGFNYLGQVDQVLAESPLLRPAPESSGRPESRSGLRPHLLEITAVIVEGRLRVRLEYSKNLHERSTIDTLGRYFMEALRSIVAHCLTAGTVGYTPSDFPRARLKQKDLDQFLTKLGGSRKGEAVEV